MSAQTTGTVLIRAMLKLASGRPASVFPEEMLEQMKYIRPAHLVI